MVGRILTSRGDSADADKFPDTAVVVGMVDFTPATPYRKLDAFTAITHSKITAKLDSHGDLHPQRETSDNTGSDTEDGIWLPTGTWKVTYRLNTSFGALPEHHIEVTTAHTEAAPLPLFANMGDPAPAGATFVQLTVPLGGQQGQVLVMNDGSLAWGDVSGGGGGGSTAWADITGKPATFAPSAHTHDDRYYTETETDAAIAAAVDGLGSVAVVSASGAHTLALSDAGKAVEITSATPVDLTVPTAATVAFPVGTVVEVCQLGAGQVSIVGAVGVAVESRGSLSDLAGQYAVASLRKRAADVWVLVGDLA